MSKIKINELINESDYLLGGDTFFRKSIFVVSKSDDQHSKLKVKTTVTALNTEDTAWVDGFAEAWINNQWQHIFDVIPRELNIENVKKAQKDLVLNTITIYWEDTSLVENLDFENLRMFDWTELEESGEKEERVLTLAFNPKDT